DINPFCRRFENDRARPPPEQPVRSYYNADTKVEYRGFRKPSDRRANDIAEKRIRLAHFAKWPALLPSKDAPLSHRKNTHRSIRDRACRECAGASICPPLMGPSPKQNHRPQYQDRCRARHKTFVRVPADRIVRCCGVGSCGVGECEHWVGPNDTGGRNVAGDQRNRAKYDSYEGKG